MAGSPLFKNYIITERVPDITFIYTYIYIYIDIFNSAESILAPLILVITYSTNIVLKAEPNHLLLHKIIFMFRTRTKGKMKRL